MFVRNEYFILFQGPEDTIFCCKEPVSIKQEGLYEENADELKSMIVVFALENLLSRRIFVIEFDNNQIDTIS